MMMSSKLAFLLFSIFLTFHNIAHHHINHINDGLNQHESGQQVVSLSSSLSLSSMSVVFCVVDALVTNSNDTTAMLAFRRTFNNFTGSNWYSNGDPCASPSNKKCTVEDVSPHLMSLR
jgi:hypothetical protein